MAEPQPALPFDHDLRSVEHHLMRDDVDYPPLDFAELPNLSEQEDFTFSNPLTMPQSPVAADGEIMGDPFVLDDNVFEDGFQTNPSTVRDETSDFGNPIQLSAWPPLQVPPYTCSCCQVLREIIHTNGVEITKFEVHGRLGIISHGILEKYGVDLTANPSHDHKMFDFCKESTGRVKQYLEEYCKDRKSNGYMMLQDPLSAFYAAVCVGLDWVYNNMDTDDLFANDSGDHQMNQQDVEISRARPSNKITLSMQRERTGKLTIKDLVDFFHVPIEVAAKRIQVCPTVIKKICRKHGLPRWPYRKINSIERKISTRSKFLTSADDEERGRAQSEIDILRQEIASIYERFNV